MNFLWIDVETTGLYADKNDIVQLACIPAIDGIEKDGFNEFCQPINWNAIEQEAVNVHGITVDRMKQFQKPEVALDKFIKYIRSFNTKFIIAGFNVDFDRQFLSAMFTKHGRSEEFFELFEINTHDTYKRVKLIKNQIKTPNHKLETLAKHYKIEIKAHDALSDIAATILVDKKISKLLKEDSIVKTDIKNIDYSSVPDFPEMAQLNVRSVYDVCESIPFPKDWHDWCIENNIPGFSVVDTSYAASLFDMVNLDKSKCIPVPGLTLNFRFNDDICKFTVWATSTQGYYNIIKLSSLGHNNVYENQDKIKHPILDPEDILKHKEGVLFGTSDVYGIIGRSISEGNLDKATKLFEKYVEIFSTDSLFVEFNPVSITTTYSQKAGFQSVKRNDVIEDGDINKSFNLFMFNMMNKYKLKAIPVTSARFINKKDKLLQDIVCKKAYKHSGMHYVESYHAKLTKEVYIELKSQLGDLLTEDIFRKWIDNTFYITNLAKDITIKNSYHMPKIEIPDTIKKVTDDYDKQTLLYTIDLCKKHGRWNDDPVYVERFKKEIDVIMKNNTINFLPYFLLYEDISAFARSQGILQNVGRGSAGGCLLSYYLKIVHIDPIENNLPFERFLSHARIKAGSFPDIDSDFGDRGPIIKYLAEKYGLGFAQMCTFQKMKTKFAIKNAMWALYGKAQNDPFVEYICKFIPDSPQGVDEYDFLYGYTNKEGEYHTGVVETVQEIRDFFQQFPQVESMVKRLIGLIGSYGRHASAYVISTLDLASERVPTMQMPDTDGGFISVTQFEAKMVEKCGLVKADILGLTTIQVVSDCIDLIRKRTGINFLEEDDKGVAHIFRLPEDKDVYTDFYNKKTDSSFQFNTSTVKNYIRDIAPLCRQDLSETTALLRPGAMDAPMSDTTAAKYYIDVRNRRRTPEYVHPDLEKYTTNAIFVFQEEIMSFLVDIVGYSLEESDVIRGAIAKKKHEVMMATFDRIRKATKERGWTEEQSQTVCEQIQAFARYSFNRAHSRSYSELGYITMYLKHYYPLEWWVSTLNNTDKEDKLRHFMTILGDMVRSPSLATPSSNFIINDDHIVAPLTVIKRISHATAESLTACGPFNTLEDLISKIKGSKVNKGHIEALILGRAADCLMDKSLPYGEAKNKLVNEYIELRKGKVQFNDSVYLKSPIDIFLTERNINTCFNKTILSDKDILDIIIENKPSFSLTGRKGVPIIDGQTPIIANVRVAEELVKRNHEGTVGMVLLYGGSTAKSGISKKNGKNYSFVKLILSDGYFETEAMIWNENKALKYPINSLIYVRGQLKEGWKNSINIEVSSIEKIN